VSLAHAVDEEFGESLAEVGEFEALWLEALGVVVLWAEESDGDVGGVGAVVIKGFDTFCAELPDGVLGGELEVLEFAGGGALAVGARVDAYEERVDGVGSLCAGGAEVVAVCGGEGWRGREEGVGEGSGALDLRGANAFEGALGGAVVWGLEASDDDGVGVLVSLLEAGVEAGLAEDLGETELAELAGVLAGPLGDDDGPALLVRCRVRCEQGLTGFAELLALGGIRAIGGRGSGAAGGKEGDGETEPEPSQNPNKVSHNKLARGPESDGFGSIWPACGGEDFLHRPRACYSL